MRAAFFFFGALSACSCAAGAPEFDASDATSDGCAWLSFGGAAAVGGSAATREGASGRAVSMGFDAVATVTGGGIGDGASARAASTDFAAAVVTVMGGGVTRGGSKRAASTDFGAGAAAMAEAGGFEVTRDGRSGRAGVTNEVADGCTALAGKGS